MVERNFLLTADPAQMTVKHLDNLKYLYYKKKKLLHDLMLELNQVRERNKVKEEKSRKKLEEIAVFNECDSPNSKS